MTVIDSLSIRGMKKSDFERLYTIFEEAQEEGYYFGRKDYWDASMKRLEKWLFESIVDLNDVKIKEK